MPDIDQEWFMRLFDNPLGYFAGLVEYGEPNSWWVDWLSVVIGANAFLFGLRTLPRWG